MRQTSAVVDLPWMFCGSRRAGSGELKGVAAAEAIFALSQVIELGGKRDARIGAAQAGRSALDIERQAAQLGGVR